MSLNPHYKKVMLDYLEAVTRGDLETVLALFSEKAMVYSPTQDEPKKARPFYTDLVTRSKGTIFVAKAVFAGEEPHLASVFFDYSKPQPDGTLKTFDCVDVFSFDANGKIDDLWIVFDTKRL